MNIFKNVNDHSYYTGRILTEALSFVLHFPWSNIVPRFPTFFSSHMCHIAGTCTSSRKGKKPMRAGVVGEGRGRGRRRVRQDEREDGGRNQSREEESERCSQTDYCSLEAALHPTIMSGGILFHLHKFAWNFSYLARPPLSELGIRLACDYSPARLPTFPPCGQRRWLGSVLAFC